MNGGLEGEPLEQQTPNRLPPQCVEAIKGLADTDNPYAPQIVSIPAKEKVIQQGDKGTEIFVLLEGSLEVRADIDGKDTHIATLSEEGVFVGEIAAIFNNPDDAQGVTRTATILANIDSTLVGVSREKFMEWNFMPGALAESFAIITDTARERVRTMTLPQLRDAGFPWASSPLEGQSHIVPEQPVIPQEQTIFSEPQVESRGKSSTPLRDRINKGRVI